MLSSNFAGLFVNRALTRASSIAKFVVARKIKFDENTVVQMIEILIGSCLLVLALLPGANSIRADLARDSCCLQ